MLRISKQSFEDEDNKMYERRLKFVSDSACTIAFYHILLFSVILQMYFQLPQVSFYNKWTNFTFAERFFCIFFRLHAGRGLNKRFRKLSDQV